MSDVSTSALASPSPPRTVHVTVPVKAYNDLESMQKVTAAVMKRLGCGACCSGFDIRFHAEDAFVVDANLNVR